MLPHAARCKSLAVPVRREYNNAMVYEAGVCHTLDELIISGAGLVRFLQYAVGSVELIDFYPAQE